MSGNKLLFIVVCSADEQWVRGQGSAQLRIPCLSLQPLTSLKVGMLQAKSFKQLVIHANNIPACEGDKSTFISFFSSSCWNFKIRL